ncbi:hypothetical protein [Nereida ignava]|uniref:hypothetical protein n=1 Tax=Nereida ignava TaxID=282199 RepID=UPI0030F93F2D
MMNQTTDNGNNTPSFDPNDIEEGTYDDIDPPTTPGAVTPGGDFAADDDEAPVATADSSGDESGSSSDSDSDDDDESYHENDDLRAGKFITASSGKTYALNNRKSGPRPSKIRGAMDTVIKDLHGRAVKCRAQYRPSAVVRLRGAVTPSSVRAFNKTQMAGKSPKTAAAAKLCTYYEHALAALETQPADIPGLPPVTEEALAAARANVATSKDAYRNADAADGTTSAVLRTEGPAMMMMIGSAVGDAVDAFAAALDSFNVNVMSAKPAKQNFDLFAISLQAALDSANDASIRQKAADVEMRVDLNGDSKPF